MSINDVTTRIAEIQAQLALLPRPTAVGGASLSGAAFSGVLSRVAAGPTMDPGTLTGVAAGSITGAVTGEQVVARAREMEGLPYVWGGTDPERGVDCSGLVQATYATFGIDLPRVSADQARVGSAVASLAEARPGDLIAWDNSSRNVGADHIAIYIGNGQMIEAPRPGGRVQVVPVTTPPDYVRRVLPDVAGSTVAPTPLSSPFGRLPAGTPYATLFERAGATHAVDPALLAAVARQESGFDPTAVSPAGAQGLMQLMPGTAAGLGVANPFDPAQAVDGAARLLTDLVGRFGRVELALAAYNAGPGAVTRYG
ncbi:MAG: transglycosylase SLT domain-containing protein, partial [Pseudonocardia sediminis]